LDRNDAGRSGIVGPMTQVMKRFILFDLFIFYLPFEITLFEAMDDSNVVSIRLGLLRSCPALCHSP
jgi:hypothetical protein